MAGLGLGDERGFWGSIFDRCADQPLAQTTWDYQWIYACWKNRGLAIYPASHLVENIGQGNEATHTFDVNPLFARRSAPLSFPLRHPAVVEDDTGLNREVFRAVFMGKRPWREKVWHGLRRRFAGVQ